jgi:alpha-D-xyloside xylohydrolase
MKIKTIEKAKGLLLEAKNDVIPIGISVKKNDDKYQFTIKKAYTSAYGFGEKFDHVNQKGNTVLSTIIEKCFAQGQFTYCTMPFFLTVDGFGIYVDTLLAVEFDLRYDNEITITFEKDIFGKIADIYYFEGTQKEIIKQYKQVTKNSKIFPKWVLGAWMSSNRWSCDENIYEQLEEMEKTKIPHNVMVIERWSDLTTFYLWNKVKYKLKKGNESLKYNELDFSNSPWKNPKKMIEELNKAGIHVLLWDLPMYASEKSMEHDEGRQQRRIDNDFVEKNKECIMTKSGEPYKIAEGNWFGSSMIPDFFNEESSKNWFSKRQHLLDIGIEGFKTDGGEFIYSDDALSVNGLTGKELKNAYSDKYISEYNKFIGDDKVLFSRAGYTNVPSNSIVWAGDQQSKWDEYRSQIKAGLTAGFSGIGIWGFDIAGFSGYLPSKELYKRATQTAAFFPIMQWHSEPPSNGFCDFTGEYKNNDRSPWNMAKYLKDENLIEEIKFSYNLHYNLIPFMYNLMLESVNSGLSIIRHPVMEFTDNKLNDIEDQFMLGNAIMVAPVLNDYINEREVYMPCGKWFDLYTGEVIIGGRKITVELKNNVTPAFVRNNTCIPLNLDNTLKIGCNIGNDLSKYNNLCFMVSGKGTYSFKDDLSNEIEIEWNNKETKIIKNTDKINIKFVCLG